jgi:hypothetical protein
MVHETFLTRVSIDSLVDACQSRAGLLGVDASENGAAAGDPAIGRWLKTVLYAFQSMKQADGYSWVHRHPLAIERRSSWSRWILGALTQDKHAETWTRNYPQGTTGPGSR